MIEKMKKIMIVSPSARKKQLLDGIRNLGVVHITEKAAPDAGMSERLASLNRIRGLLAERAQKGQKFGEEILTGASFEALHSSLAGEADEKRVAELKRLKQASQAGRQPQNDETVTPETKNDPDPKMISLIDALARRCDARARS